LVHEDGAVHEDRVSPVEKLLMSGFP
jgi:hypothetical protein